MKAEDVYAGTSERDLFAWIMAVERTDLVIRLDDDSSCVKVPGMSPIAFRDSKSSWYAGLSSSVLQLEPLVSNAYQATVYTS